MTSHTNIGLGEQAIDSSVATLETYLADSNVLYVKTQGFHWNIVSSDFPSLHQLLESQYEDLASSIDETAERMRKLGRHPVASLETFLANTQLSETSEAQLSDTMMLEILLDDHETLCRFLRTAIGEVQQGGDEVTADYFIARLSAHEKTAWFLRSTLASRTG